MNNVSVSITRSVLIRWISTEQHLLRRTRNLQPGTPAGMGGGGLWGVGGVKHQRWVSFLCPPLRTLVKVCEWIVL